MSKNLTLGWVVLGSVAFGALFLAINPEYSPFQGPSSDATKGKTPAAKLVAFKTDAAWAAFVEQRAALAREAATAYGPDILGSAPSDSPPPQDAAAPSMSPPPPLVERKTSVVADATNPEITNNQNVGVDEGGIVKQVGPYLLALQDGRIFSVDTRGNNGKIALADRMNVYTKANEGAWYDEMLVQGDRVLVTAYSYEAQATAISVFRVDMASGKLSRDGIFYVSSADYYSGENYATRIVGDQLVLHITSSLTPSWSDENAPMIRVGPYESGAKKPRGVPLVSTNNLYRPIMDVANPAVQTIVICPLGDTKTKDLSCRSESFVGPLDSELLVTTTDAFLWNGDENWLFYETGQSCDRWQTRCANMKAPTLTTLQPAAVFRVPINGDAPSFAPVRGRPTNQFAMEVQNNKFFMLSSWNNPNCASTGYGIAPQLSLTTIPLSRFDDAPAQIKQSSITNLPGAMAEPVVRFMEGWVVYHGDGDDITVPSRRLTRLDAKAPTTLYATPLKRPRETVSTAVPHRVARLQPLAGGMLAIGQASSRDLSLSWLNPSASFKPAPTFSMSGRIESEGRSHAFSATQLGDGRSLMGLPTVEYNDGQVRDLSRSASSNLSFLTMSKTGSFAKAGDVSMAQTKPKTSYKCEVSCIDWYGNSRAVFTGGRIFALMGTELVEGRLTDNQISVIGRLDMTAPFASTSN